MQATNNSAARREQAAAWHVRLSAPDAGEAAWLEFTDWLEADPANRLAYDSVERLDAELQSQEVAAFVRETGEAREPARMRSRTPWIAGAALLAASLLVFVFFPRTAHVTYETAIGETKTVTLADGTRIDLNSGTSLSAEVENNEREVTLHRGEALFHVTHDPSRPFLVEAGDRDVHVVGTVFDVTRSEGTIAIVVAEGRVAVTPRGADAHSRATLLGPGQRLVAIEGAETATLEQVSPTDALAWRQGYLVYRDAPLARVIADLNRYFPVAIVLEGEAASQRFTGVLRIDSQDAVLRRISALLPVTAVRRTDGRIGLRPSPKP